MIKEMCDKYPWLINIIGVICFVLSPVLMPIMILWEHKKDTIQYYKDCFEAMFNKGR